MPPPCYGTSRRRARPWHALLPQQPAVTATPEPTAPAVGSSAPPRAARRAARPCAAGGTGQPASLLPIGQQEPSAMADAVLIAPFVAFTSCQQPEKLGAGQQLQAALELASRRIADAVSFRWFKPRSLGNRLWHNTYIHLDEGLDHLAPTSNAPDTVLPLAHDNPGHASPHINDASHWTQDVWGVPADAGRPESLLKAKSIPQGKSIVCTAKCNDAPSRLGRSVRTEKPVPQNCRPSHHHNQPLNTKTTQSNSIKRS